MASQRTILTSNNPNSSTSGSNCWNEYDNGSSVRRCCPPVYETANNRTGQSYDSQNWHFFHSYPTPYSSFKKTSNVTRPRYNPMAIVSKPLQQQQQQQQQQPLNGYSNYHVQTEMNYPSLSPSLSPSAQSSSYYYNSAYSPSYQQQQQQRYSAINEQKMFYQQQQHQQQMILQQQQQRHLYYHQSSSRGASGAGVTNGVQSNSLYCTQSCCQPSLLSPSTSSSSTSSSSSSSSSFYSRPVSKKYFAETNSKLNLREFLETWNENSDESIVTDEPDATTTPTNPATNYYDLDRIFSDDAFWLSSFSDDIEVARMIDELNYECRSKMTNNSYSDKIEGDSNYDDVTKSDDNEWLKNDSGSDETTTTLLPIT